MKSTLLIVILVVVYLVQVSCNQLTPAGVWKSFQTDLMVDNVSDQGPYGGHQSLFWKSAKQDAFTSTKVLDFASKNSWTFIDSFKCSQEQTSKWIYNGEPVFPLTNNGLSNNDINNSQVAKFPRRFDGEITILRFKTGWITVEPGTDSSNEETGYALINNNGTELAVYHLWGE